MALDSSQHAYLHVPFCRHRCGYCNFAVVAGREDLATDYLRAVEIELQWLQSSRPVKTLYFGGGTPTRLPPDLLRQLLVLASSWFPPDEAHYHEWTVEANPEDVSPETIALLAEQGVTRLSLGVQSLDADKLALLERSHTSQRVADVVAWAQQVGLQVSIDLIFAAPGETLAAWYEDLDRAIALAPDHISVYGLTYEKGTSFWSRRDKALLKEADEDLQREMYVLTIKQLTDARFEHYEVSNYAQPGKRSQHNEAYWRGAEYFAAGPGAARYVAGIRETNHRSTTTYLKRVLNGESPVAEREQLDPEQRARERLVFGLRRLEGIELAQFQAATGFTVDQLSCDAIRKYIELGLLEADAERLRLTREGLLVSDAIWPDLL